MRGIRAKVNAAGPFHAAEIRIDGDGVEDAGVQQFQKHTAAPFRFNGVPMPTSQISLWRGVICCQADPEPPAPLRATGARQPTLPLRAGA